MPNDFHAVVEMAELLRVRPGTVRTPLWRGEQSLLPMHLVLGGASVLIVGAVQLRGSRANAQCQTCRSEEVTLHADKVQRFRVRATI